MKLIIALVCLLSLTSCFWNSHKDKAIEAVQMKMEKDFIEETRGVLTDKPIFQKKYATTLISKTSFEATKVEKTPNAATITVHVKTVPATARQSLREILSKQNESRETNFNTTEALVMIYQQLKLSTGTTQDFTMVVQLKKNIEWEVVSLK